MIQSKLKAYLRWIQALQPREYPWKYNLIQGHADHWKGCNREGPQAGRNYSRHRPSDQAPLHSHLSTPKPSPHENVKILKCQNSIFQLYVPCQHFYYVSQTWWCTSVIPAVGRQGQMDHCKLKASLVYIASCRPAKATLWTLSKIK